MDPTGMRITYVMHLYSLERPHRAHIPKNILNMHNLHRVQRLDWYLGVSMHQNHICCKFVIAEWSHGPTCLKTHKFSNTFPAVLDRVPHNLNFACWSGLCGGPKAWARVDFTISATVPFAHLACSGILSLVCPSAWIHRCCDQFRALSGKIGPA